VTDDLKTDFSAATTRAAAFALPGTPRAAAEGVVRAPLLALMFHRAQAGPLGNPPEMLDAHFAHIAGHYPCVLPGEPLTPGRLNVCLTFDDGYFDFHRIVLPLLEKHRLRALLALSPGLIMERTSLPDDARLRLTADCPVPHEIAGGLCTWAELREIAASGLVAFAAHGMTHARLDDPAADLNREISDPGLVLASKLIVRVDSFVLPFGRWAPRSLQAAQSHYPHVFRIGQALNSGWRAPLLYRVGADNLSAPDAPFTPASLRRYRVRAWWNRLRLS